jgi:xylulokinase
LVQATIGIDIGTSAVKVVTVGLDGKVIASASRAYPSLTPRTGWAEQRPADWWAATCDALLETADRTGGADIIGVGLSGQLNGMVLLDGDDRCLGNAIIWLDGRAAAEAADLSRRFGSVLRRDAKTELNAIAVMAKLAWLARHEPDRVSRTRSILLVKDYIAWRLTGVRQTDPSDASATGMMNAATFEWIDQLCEGAGIARAVLPPIGRSTAIMGHVTGPAAAATGLAPGLPVVPGGGDVAALAVGCGVINNAVLGITLGTAGHVVLARDAAEPFNIGGGIWRVPHADPELSVWLGLVMSGGLSLSWLHALLGSAGPQQGFEAMVELAEPVNPGANGVSFVPFLEGAATPYGTPGARGAFCGLSSSSRAGELVRAVMEGVAFNVRQCVEAFAEHGGTFERVHIAEGGARVGQWCQIMADVLGQALVRLPVVDASSFGAALMAQSGVTGVSLDQLGRKLGEGGEVFTPDGTRKGAYDTAYRRYLVAAEGEIARTATLDSQ